jgi:hypothetical protein
VDPVDSRQAGVEEGAGRTMAAKALIDYSDDELRDAYRTSVTRVEYSSTNYWEELLGRQQRRARALNRWTFVMAIATLVNAGAAVVLLVRALGYIAGKPP